MSAPQITTVDLTDTRARAERDHLATRVDVLDKVGVLRTLPDDMHVTTTEAAAFYEVDVELVRYHLKANRDELESDGYRVVSRADFEREFDSLSNLDPRARSVGLLPRRAILRLGMLLRDSPVARRVRDYLLEAEQASPFRVPQTMSEALRLAADEHEARELAEAKVRELEPKADLADNYLLAQGGARLVRQVAKTFGMKEHELRTFLIDEGLIYVRHSQCGEVYYDHYAQYAHYFLPREKIVQHRWGHCSHYTLNILPRGVELISRRLRSRGAES